MPVVYGFKRNNNPVNGDNTFALYNESDGTITFTIKREPVGEATNPYQITWFKLDWYHWNGLTSSDYRIVTKPQSDSLVDGYYYFASGQTEFDIKIELVNDSIDESTLLEGLTVEITDVQELSLDSHVVASSQHETLSPITSIGIVDDDRTQIGLWVNNTTGNEGGSVGFVVGAEKPVPYDTLVYLQVNPYTTTASIADGSWWVSGVIRAGETSVTINIKTVDDGQTDNRRIDVKLFSYDDNFVITDGTAYGTVYNTTLVAETLPTLSLYAGGDTNEGDFTTSYAELDKAVGHDVTFTATTYKGTYNQANVLGAGGDYEGFIDISFTIPAGQTKVAIPVKTIQNPDSEDWAEELFELGVSNVQGANLANDKVMLKIIDVATWEITPAITKADLATHAEAFNKLEADVGTTSAADFVGDNHLLSSLGKTMEAVGGLLSQSFLSAVSWFSASTAYASVGELPALDSVQNEVNKGIRINKQEFGVYTPPVEWTREDLERPGFSDLALRINDTVDGKVVIGQPFDSLAIDGHRWQVVQGMSDGGNGMTSHITEGKSTPSGLPSFGHQEVSLDYNLTGGYLQTPGVDPYFYAQASGKVVSYIDNTTGNGPGELGNSITILLDQKATINGEKHDVYMTYAHAKTGSIAAQFPDNWKDAHVEAGTPLGIVGATGFVEGKHIHVSFGTDTYRGAGFEWEGSKSVTKSGAEDVPHEITTNIHDPEEGGIAIPAVYLIGLGDVPVGDGLNLQPTSLGNIDFIGPLPISVYPIIGTKGDDNFIGESGDNHYFGDDGVDTITYNKPVTEFNTQLHTDGVISVYNIDYGVDILEGVERIVFSDGLYNIVPGTNSDEVLTGTDSNDLFAGGDGHDTFFGSLGDDIYVGGGGPDQVDYHGPNSHRSNFTFTENADASVSVDSPYGHETYIGIVGVWFQDEQVWYNMDQLI
ncbi:MAG: hypothetical protein H6779_02710 [Candidatus Nomurabacteria bacterium]|nr:hypothetical protein [Candidatus Nomurabacteria bacterium]USN87301.1 MAG: hypothetical protein H6779_02710 [Candidatus Nomurabacteria bacterium]